MIDFMPLTGGHQGQSLVLLLTALAMDFCLGLVPGVGRVVPDRLGVFSVLAQFFDTRLNRAGRSEANLLVRGAVVTLMLAATAASAGLVLTWAVEAMPYGWALELAFLVVCLSGRRVMGDLRHGLPVMGEDDLQAGQKMIALALGRDASRLDKYGVGRVVVEMAAVGFARRLVVPVFWFVLLGFPGVLVWRAVSRIAAATVGRDMSALAFGAAAIRLDHVLGLLPSMIASWLLAVASVVVPQARIASAFAAMSRDAARDEIVNDGRMKGAAAGALGLALGSPFGTKGGGGVRDAWIGNGRARVGQGDIRRMFYLIAVASLLLLAVVASLTAVRL